MYTYLLIRTSDTKFWMTNVGWINSETYKIPFLTINLRVRKRLENEVKVS